MQATRSAALSILSNFASAMGQQYERGRNFDNGPGRHSAVSQLSPFIARRLATEQQVVQAALEAHGPDAASKFVEEVFWRGYFKGWLELRPSIWATYIEGLSGDLTLLDKDKRMRAGYQTALAGETGIECFDAWVRELNETGYLHNHARMWFASIWIFTLQLPWRLGADFFYRHLLDGDAASNTLSWRWVAGLHTRGKPYAARAYNIATFTGRRFTPSHDELAEVTEGLEASEPDGLPPAGKPREVLAPHTGVPSALLLTDQDCCLEDFDVSQFEIVASATLTTSRLRSPLAVSDLVENFETEALADLSQRLGFDPDKISPDQLVDWATTKGVKQLITPYITQGPTYDFMMSVKSQLVTEGIELAELKREWDSLTWPHAKAGFFRVKKQIPEVLERLGFQS